MRKLKLDDFKFDHIGIVCKDINKAAKFYTKAFGIKWDKITENDFSTDFTARGKPTPHKSKIAFASMGQIRLELVQIIDGQPIHAEFLKTNGEGIHHLSFLVKDLDGEVSNAEWQGLEVVSYFKVAGIMALAYIDFLNKSGILIELAQENLLEKVQATLANQ